MSSGMIAGAIIERQEGEVGEWRPADTGLPGKRNRTENNTY